MKEYFFEDVEDLIGHLKSLDSDMGPIRLQKTIYFLYAFYGATYGSIKGVVQGNSDNLLSEIGDSIYPPKLFDAKFEAWQYGPVIRDVYFKNKTGDYDELEDKLLEKYTDRNERDVIVFLDDIVSDLNELSDFALVDRTHRDEAWRKKFDKMNPYQSEEIDNDELIAEYKKRIEEVSKILVLYLKRL